jgi:N-acetylmuramoyl-L-alanine amidase
VLRETIDYFPSMLLELGFLSNPDESNYLIKVEKVNSMAVLLLQCIVKYL